MTSFIILYIRTLYLSYFNLNLLSLPAAPAPLSCSFPIVLWLPISHLRSFFPLYSLFRNLFLLFSCSFSHSYLLLTIFRTSFLPRCPPDIPSSLFPLPPLFPSLPSPSPSFRSAPPRCQWHTTSWRLDSLSSRLFSGTARISTSLSFVCRSATRGHYELTRRHGNPFYQTALLSLSLSMGRQKVGGEGENGNFLL